MVKRIFKENEKFNKLRFVKDLENKNNSRIALWRCDCGNELSARVSDVLAGTTRSCGCLRNKHGLRKHPLYQRWLAMKQRCDNKNAGHWDCYGGRGIKVCDEWSNDFKSFYDWSIRNGYKKYLQLDRINNDGNYEPENCQYITDIQNKSIGKTRIRKDNISGTRGVYWDNTFNKWIASIQINKKQTILGRFNNKEDAINIRLKAEGELVGKT
jgi:hypothetical protein